MYKVILTYPDGTTEEYDEVFETEAAARDFGIDQRDGFVAGAEDLHMSNPGDYPTTEDADEVDFKVIDLGS